MKNFLVTTFSLVALLLSSSCAMAATGAATGSAAGVQKNVVPAVRKKAPFGYHGRSAMTRETILRR